tara:strand:- start:1078 stop:1266 length:189 start_codon:yes stop_codon:yes gene_type:complete
MKVKGLKRKIYRVNPNSVLCSVADFDILKDGKTATLKISEANQLLNMGVVEEVKAKKGVNNG